MTRRRRWAVTAAVWVAIILVFAASYRYNMNGIGLWVVAVVLSVYAIGSWVYRHARGKSLATF